MATQQQRRSGASGSCGVWDALLGYPGNRAAVTWDRSPKRSLRSMRGPRPQFQQSGDGSCVKGLHAVASATQAESSHDRLLDIMAAAVVQRWG